MKNLRIPAPVAIFFVSLIFNFLLFFVQGIKMGGDSSRYISGAENLLAGIELNGKQTPYFGFILVVAFFKTIHLGANGLVLFQIIIASLAAVFLFKIGSVIGNKSVGILSAAYFNFNIDIANWHLYVLTDSLYTSFVVFSVWGIWKFHKNINTFYRLVIISVIVLTILLRPNGWSFVLVFAYLLIYQLDSFRKKLAAISIVFSLFIAALFILKPMQDGLQHVDILTNIKKGTTIWGHDKTNLKMPQDSSNENGILAAKNYIFKHPIACAKLFTARILVELVHLRPYFSKFHNGFVAVFIVLLYPFAVLGFFRLRKNLLVQLMLAVVLLQMAIIGLTYDDWDGRFLIYILPLISTVAIAEIFHLKKEFFSSSKPHA